MNKGFVEYAEGVYVLRYPVLDVNITLIVGDDAALVVDTLSTAGQAHELADEIRNVMPAGWSFDRLTIVNTHDHFDHCFGNDVLAGLSAGSAGSSAGSPVGDGCEIWAHEACAQRLRDDPAGKVRRAHDQWGTEAGMEGLADVTIRPPTHTVHSRATLTVGGREVQLRHLGAGHSPSDLVIAVPDADMVVAGDLVEEGAPPAYGDGYPLQWPDVTAELVRQCGADTVVVPGHGAVVGRGFVRDQHVELAAMAWLIRDGHADDTPVEEVAKRGPFDHATALSAAKRGYAELDGRI